MTDWLSAPACHPAFREALANAQAGALNGGVIEAQLLGKLAHRDAGSQTFLDSQQMAFSDRSRGLSRYRHPRGFKFRRRPNSTRPCRSYRSRMVENGSRADAQGMRNVGNAFSGSHAANYLVVFAIRDMQVIPHFQAQAGADIAYPSRCSAHRLPDLTVRFTSRQPAPHLFCLDRVSTGPREA